jgi:hypothetical protein
MHASKTSGIPDKYGSKLCRCRIKADTRNKMNCIGIFDSQSVLFIRKYALKVTVKKQPVASNDTVEGRQSNRRTEVRIISD